MQTKTKKYRESDPRMVVVYLIVFLLLCLLVTVLAFAPDALGPLVS